MNTTSQNTSPLPINAYWSKFYNQGVHSYSEYDKLVANNVYPISLLSSDGKRKFRSKLKFTNGKATGLGTDALDELGYEKYVDLIKVVAGVIPIIINESSPRIPQHDPNYPIQAFVEGYEPREESAHRCIVSGGSMCWVPGPGPAGGAINVYRGQFAMPFFNSINRYRF